MKILRTFAISVMATFGGSMVGGFVGGAALALVANFPDLSRAISFSAGLGGFGIYLLGVFAMAWLGAVGGPMVGLVPTLVLGSLLWILKVFQPFRYALTWAATGLAVGVILHLWLGYGRPTTPLSSRQMIAWTIAWAAGGAASMSIYWVAAIGAWRTR